MEIPSEMQHQQMGYDRAATMFSPDGHLLQVEYAEKTVRLGSTSIAVVCKDGIVFVADRRIRDKLITPESANKILEIDSHVVGTAAGILSDARVLVDEAQVVAQQHRVTYDSPIEPISVIKMIADKKQMSTQYGGLRPYGVSLMVGGVSKNKAYLYTSDVTGNYFSYRANAIGENDEQIKEILRSEFKEEMNMDEGIKFILGIFKKILGKNFETDRFDVAHIGLKDQAIVRLHGDSLKKHIK
ncbi:MAG: archaeal proteasome endopeptidase complex subunit alpha [Nanoarchaeota archaeon]|mgnify:CR=1 FL=1